MKNHFDAFDQWILTDNWNIYSWQMDTYYSFMAASKVGSRCVFDIYRHGKCETQRFMVWCSWFLQNQVDGWIAEILPFLTTYSMFIIMKVEAGYVTAQCRHSHLSEIARLQASGCGEVNRSNYGLNFGFRNLCQSEDWRCNINWWWV